MNRITMTMVRYGLPHHIPQAISGRSGKLYGHAVYQDRYHGHAITFTPEQIEDGSFKDALRSAVLSRSVSDLNIIAEVLPDPESAEAKLAEALDLARAEIDELKGKIVALERQVPPAEPVPHTASAEPPPAGNPLDELPETRPGSPAVEHDVKDAEPETCSDERRLALEAMEYRELRARAKQHNEKAIAVGLPEPIALNPSPKKPDLVNAILTHEAAAA